MCSTPSFRRAMVIFGCLILSLAACRPAPETAVTRTLPVTTPTTIKASATTRPTATAVAQQPTGSADDGTTTTQSTEIASTPEAGLVPLAFQEETTFTVATQLGGVFNRVAIAGNTIYLGIGSRFATVDISNRAEPRMLWKSNPQPDVIGAIAVQSGLAFLRVGADLLIYDASNPALPALVGKFSGISGDLFASDDLVYAFASRVPNGAQQALIIIDVSDPSQPSQVGTHQLSSPASLVASDEVLYVVSGGGAANDNRTAATLQLVDRRNPESTLGQVALDAASHYSVAIMGNHAFVVENRFSGGPVTLRVIDVSDPSQPAQIATRQIDSDFEIQRIMVTDDSLFLLARSFPHTGCPILLYVFDITDPASLPEPAGIDPQSCFNEFALDGDTLAATSERGLQIFDISAAPDLALVGELPPQDGFLAVERVALDRELAYLQTTAGRNRLHRLQVLDVTTELPTLLSGNALDVQIEPSIFEGMEVRGDRVFGLGPYAVDISDPANLRLVTDDLAQENAPGVFYWPSPALVDNALYTGLLSATPDGLMIGGGVGIVDIDDTDNPILVNTVSIEDAMIMGLSVTDENLIVISQKIHSQTEHETAFITRLQIFDVSNPLAPVETGRLEPVAEVSEQVWDFVVAGDTVYAVSAHYGDANEYKLYAVDISVPSSPARIGQFELSDNVTKMVAAGDTIYMRHAEGGLWALNISDPAQPYLSGQFPTHFLDFAVGADALYLAVGDAGLLVLHSAE